MARTGAPVLKKKKVCGRAPLGVLGTSSLHSFHCPNFNGGLGRDFARLGLQFTHLRCGEGGGVAGLSVFFLF